MSNLVTIQELQANCAARNFPIPRQLEEKETFGHMTANVNLCQDNLYEWLERKAASFEETNIPRSAQQVIDCILRFSRGIPPVELFIQGNTVYYNLRCTLHARTESRM